MKQSLFMRMQYVNFNNYLQWGTQRAQQLKHICLIYKNNNSIPNDIDSINAIHFFKLII